MHLNRSDTVVFKIGGESNNAQQPIPGIDYDQLQLGTRRDGYGGAGLDEGPGIDLDGANLDLESFGNIAAEPGSVYTLISNPAGGPIEGTFAGLPKGSTVYVGDIPFILSYHGGASGNDVILTEVGRYGDDVDQPDGGFGATGRRSHSRPMSRGRQRH